MIALLLCIVAFATCFTARRRGIANGILAVLVWGFAHGLLRANIVATASHFIFDAALLGLYSAELLARVTPAQRAREYGLREWVVALTLLPGLLLLLPVQDPLVQLVGFRAAVLFLPLLLIGARLDIRQIGRLAVGVSALNIVAFAFAVAEYLRGVEPFYPKSPVTDIIYRSNDVLAYTFFRIPGTFSNAGVYGATMVLTLPIIFVALSTRNFPAFLKIVCLAGAVCAIMGVFMSASRSAALLLFVVLAVAVFEHARGTWGIGVVTALTGVAAVVSTAPRLQRFLSLTDVSLIQARLRGSVGPMDVGSIITRYPFGNGLGSAQINLPYFLQDRVASPVVIENEYARLLLEQGLLGLALWVAFLAWAFWGIARIKGTSGLFTVQITCAAAFVFALTGTGLTFTIPSTVLLYLSMGWMIAMKEPHGAHDQHRLVMIRRASVSMPEGTSRGEPITVR